MQGSNNSTLEIVEIGDRRILTLNFENVGIKELPNKIRQETKEIVRLKENGRLSGCDFVMADVRGTLFGVGVVDALIHLGRTTKGFFTASAVVGITGMKEDLFNMFAKMFPDTKRRAFRRKKDAQQWLLGL